MDDTSWRIHRGAVALGLLLVGSFLVALLVNLALFRFGPWADVWFEETFVALLTAGLLVLAATHGRRLN